MTDPRSPRRRFIASAAARTGAGAALLGAPAISRAQTITLRFQSTWPQKDIFHEFAGDFARRVNEMPGGRLRIDVLPAGAVVKAFDLLDGVARGALDGGHGLLAYWYAKNSALALWGTGPAFGMDANMLLAWHRYGGGRQLLEEIYASLDLDVVSFLYGPMPTQPLGWFKRPVTRAEQFRGMRFRTVGLSIDLFSRMGAVVNALPGAEVVPAMDRGLLDGAEFSNASSDRLLGFPDVAKVCMLQSFHQPAEAFEILFNRRRFEALPVDLRAIIRHAIDASSADMSWKAIDRFSRDHLDLQQKQGVQFHRTPEAILRAQLSTWDEIVEQKSAENPMFRSVYESQRVFAARATRWQDETQVDFRLAYEHFFAPRKT